MLRVLVAAVFAVPFAASASERGAPPVEVFDVQALRVGASTSTNVAQMPDGRILVANMGGLIRYDGSRWQVSLHPGQMGGMEFLALDAQQRMHTSFSGDIGHWADDATGTLQWHSVLARVPEACRDVTNETIAVLEDAARQGVWFAAATSLVFVPHAQSGEVRCARHPGMRRVFLVAGDVLVVHGESPTLGRVDEDLALQPIPGTDALPALGVSAAASTTHGDLLLTVDGLLLRYHERGVVEWSTALREIVRDAPTNPFNSMAQLPDGRIAVSGFVDGIYLLAADGSVDDHLGARDGVPVGRPTYGMFVDRDGDLWLAQQNTVVRVGVGSALTVFDARHGMPAAAHMARWRGDFWVASFSGLFKLRGTPSGGEFVAPIPKLAGLRGMAVLSDELMLVTAGTLVAIRPEGEGYAVDREALSDLLMLEASRFVPGRAYAGTRTGLVRIDAQPDGSLRVSEVGPIGMPVVRLAEEDADTLWVADRVDGAWRIELGAEGVQKFRYGVDKGLPQGTTRMFSGPRRIWFTTLQGLRAYDAASDSFVVPEGIPPEIGADRMYSAYEDHDGNIWVRGGAILNDVFWREADGWRIDRDLIHAVDPAPTILTFLREGDIVWAARSNGLLRVDLARHRPTPPPRLPILTQVTDTRGRAALPLDALGALAPTVRDLRIEHALPFVRRGSETQYRSRLAGFDEWSDWVVSGQQARVFTNLPDGEYRFEVEARDALQRTSALAPVAIGITPPWYRTTWARIAYAFAAILALWLAMRLGARRRQRQWREHQRELEATVAARTADLAASNAQLAEQSRQLSEQAERLTEVDRLKTRFFVNVGHEFRTPLTLVLGPVDDLLRDARERLGERVRAQLELVQRNARRVLDLIVEMLDVNRLEQGRLPLRLASHDLAALLTRVAADFQPLLDRYGQSLRIDVPGESAFADIDALQVERCLSNLLGNAAKYSPRGSEIALTLSRNGAGWEIAVRDQGRGIAPQALPHVFDRFFQAEGSDRASGYGIGLSLVREIALAHGGDVSVASEYGAGSTFVLRLPAAAAGSQRAPEPAPVAPESIEPEAPAARAGGGRERLLVVDDHDDMRERVRALLSDRFEVLEAADGEQAWRIARAELPDLIVSDVMMPGCDGVELTRRLRAHADTGTIGILLLTAKAGSEHAVAGLKAGANDYLAKPFDSSELLARCEAIVAHARRLQHRLAAAASLPPFEVVESDDSRWRQRLDQQIAAHLHDPAFGVEELAERMHIDRTHLFRRCKELLGMSPSDYLREARLAQGQRLLESGSGNISEVAYASGFDSLSSFTRAFKARYGVPPSQVRARAAS